MLGTSCWRGTFFFEIRKDRGYVCIFAIFWRGWECMCVYTRTRTHTSCGAFRCEPRGQGETLGGLEESRWTQFWHICIRTCGQSAHVIYVCLAAIKSELTDFFSSNRNFLPNKNVKRCEHNTENSNPTGFELIDPP